MNEIFDGTEGWERKSGDRRVNALHDKDSLGRRRSWREGAAAAAAAARSSIEIVWRRKGGREAGAKKGRGREGKGRRESSGMERFYVRETSGRPNKGCDYDGLTWRVGGLCSRGMQGTF
eukprot:767941-Hanusia_phi.AAC.4